MEQVFVCMVGTDVVVLGVAVFGAIKPTKLWLTFGTGATTVYSESLTFSLLTRFSRLRSGCADIPVLHSQTVHEAASSFSELGKKTAWMSWLSSTEVSK